MALFEKKDDDKRTKYMVLYAKDGETVIAFINPSKNVKLETLKDALVAKTLNVEIRESADEIVDIEL